MSVILALETAVEQSSLALVEGDQLIFELSVHHGRDLSRVLIPAIDRCFELSGRRINSVDALGVSVGPGSFTGLRIGVTAAKTIAFALSRPVAPVSTLRALAMALTPCRSGRVVPVLDARRSEVFAAVFEWDEGELRRIRPDSLVSLAELPQFAQGGEPPAGNAGGADSTFFVSPGVPGLELAVGRSWLVQAYPQARSVADRAGYALAHGGAVDPVELVPHYLRRSYAEENAKHNG